MHSAQVIADELSQIVNKHGQETVFKVCDAIYEGRYRSAPIPASEFMAEGYSLEQIAEQVREDRLTVLFEQEYGVIDRLDLDDDNDDQLCMLEEFIASHEMPLPEVTEETPMVWLCNYKGEEEGWALQEDVKHLQVFVDKHVYL
ncbi:hypothetical protein [Neptuniibacter sp. QD37_11]|uniref:hypothetical protein n=1 Tax=Neptuniibacter sp. QD37_11 TaxID=3398209 RepID=UPI0039F592F5